MEKTIAVMGRFPSGGSSHYINMLPQTLMLAAALLLTLVAPYSGALVSSALIVIFPRNYFRSLVFSAFVGLVFTTASKEVGIDLSEDFARYYEIYKQFVQTYDLQLLYGAFKPWEIGLPTIFLVCGTLFGNVSEQELLLIFSVITLTSALGTSIYLARSLELGFEERRVLIGMTLLLFPVLVSTQLLRQYFSALLILAAWFSKRWSLRAGLLAIGVAFHTSAIAIFIGLLVSGSWTRLLLFAATFTLLFSRFYVESYFNFNALNLLTALESHDSNNVGSIIRAALMFVPCVLSAAALKRARWPFELRVFLFALLMLIFIPNQQVAFRLAVPYFDMALGLLIGLIVCQFGVKMRLCLIMTPFLLGLYSGRFVEGAFLWQQYEPFGWPAAYLYIYGGGG